MEENNKQEKKITIKALEKMIGDFEKRVKNENDLLVVLLKGHLLIEYYLNYVILLKRDIDIRLDKISFYEKIGIVEVEKVYKPNVIACLRSLNDVRNELSHEIDCNISESEIDSIGFNLGKSYVLKKFKDTITEENKNISLKNLLIWVLNGIMYDVFFPVFMAIYDEEEKESEKKAPSIVSVPAIKTN